MNSKEIFFAGGCFWGVDKYFASINGVISTESGYANGQTDNPTYEDVIAGSGHAETVKVIYNPHIIELDKLLELFYEIINPTSLNKQGNDIGVQYRTGVYYTDVSDKTIIQDSIARLQKKYTDTIVIEVQPLINYFSAEDFHQKYLDKNPWGYCHIDPSAFEKARTANPIVYKRKSKEDLKKELTPIQYDVTQNNHTEPAFQNEYFDNKKEGIYVDITTREPLFVSTDQFDSGCGWPSFSKPISADLIEKKTDISHNMIRTEVRSKTGDAHLGHLFADGPASMGGMRYCINSASLHFVPRGDMARQGYENYLVLFDKK